MKYLSSIITSFFLSVASSPAIEIVLDFTLDEQNHNWFDPSTSEGLARRHALESAADFLSTIIRNDDWNALPTLNEFFSISDLSESTIKNLSGAVVTGSPESDGVGFRYSIPTTNRASVGANEYIIYVGAFVFDSGASGHAKGGWDSSDRRNAAGFALTEFNTWGGRIWFDISNDWYVRSNPGFNPTNNYGIQDPNKSPSSDISSDNWDWSNSSSAWKGFHLSTIDSSIAGGAKDLYSIGLHEMLHALGLTNLGFENYIGLNSNGNAIGANLVAEYGGPVPFSSSGHFAHNIQSEVWDSEGIISEATLDPSSTSGRRKYLTKLDAAALRDLGYNVAVHWREVAPDYKLGIGLNGEMVQLNWVSALTTNHVIEWSTDLKTWTSIPVGKVNAWSEPLLLHPRRFYRVTD